MAKYIKNEIAETASQTDRRRRQAKEISREEFISHVGAKVWEAFCNEFVNASNTATAFFKSTMDGKPCYFAEVGNIDRIFG